VTKFTIEVNKDGHRILIDTTKDNREVLRILPEPKEEWEPTNLAILPPIKSHVVYNGLKDRVLRMSDGTHYKKKAIKSVV
jgi:hypothetical protein